MSAYEILGTLYPIPNYSFSRNILAYSYADVNEFVAKPHGRLLKGPEGHALYKKTTDEVLEISATLDDTKKVRKHFM